tara:strand:+ start:15437 stop:16498 length:1062 start_codon:yes stop_codon:yes gene_type:complete
VIIVTVGPSCNEAQILQSMKQAGASCFRINLSHTKQESLNFYWNLLSSQDIIPAIDTQGAQVRLNFKDKESHDFAEDEDATIHFDKVTFAKSLNDTDLFCPTNSLFDQIKVGMKLRCDFNSLLLVVSHINYDEKIINLKVSRKGNFTSNRAIDLLGSKVKLPAITEYDRYAIDFAITKGLKTLFLSFTSSIEDVENLKKIAPNVEIIAKIESRKGLENIDEIVSGADGILVDRGDLSREISIGLVPYAVETVLDVCLKQNKPCYIATNVLDSMMTVDLPSRAEISDIWNLMSRGVSGFVLAAEAAIGAKPVESIQVVNHMQRLHKLSKHSFISLIDTDLLNTDLPNSSLTQWM